MSILRNIGRLALRVQGGFVFCWSACVLQTPRCIGLLASCLSLAASAAAAQVAPPTLPQSIQPGRALQQPLQAPVPSGPGGAVELPAPVDGAPPQGAEGLTFTLRDVAISGATVYPAAALRPFYEKSIGQTVSLADVYRWAAEITQKYRASGYVLSQVLAPQQRIDGGVVRLVVVEGFVDQVTIKGVSDRRLQAIADHIKRYKPLTAVVLERYLLLANDLPGLSVQGVLSPSATTPGAADLTLTARRKTTDASLEVDNFGTAYQGPWQGTATVGVNGLLGQDERVALRYTSAGDTRELGVAGLDIALPVGSNGTEVVVAASHIEGHPGYALTPFDVHTVGNGFSLALQHPLIRSRAQNLTLSATFAYLDSTTTLNIPSSSDDKVRALRFTAAYSLIDGFGGRNAVTAEVSEGLPVLGYTRKGAALASRAGASNDFTKTVISASRLQDLGQGFALLGALSAQTSFGDRLLSSEQFGLGGPVFGRGYDPSEITGDSGVAGKVELQKNLVVPDTHFPAQLFGFYDAGEVFSQASTDGVPARQSLASTGGGVRLDIGHGVTSTLFAAKPLTRDVAAEIGHVSDPKGVRAYFMLSASF